MLDENGVRAELGAPPELSLNESSARSYIGDVMSKLSRKRDVRERDADLFDESARPRQVIKSTWERITLARDVELHVRRPLSREQNRLVERLLNEARTIFPEEP